MNKIRIAMIQALLRGSAEARGARVGELVGQAAAQKADLVTLPEIWNGPYQQDLFPSLPSLASVPPGSFSRTWPPDTGSGSPAAPSRSGRRKRSTTPHTSLTAAEPRSPDTGKCTCSISTSPAASTSWNPRL